MTMPMGRSLDRMMGQMGSDDGCECVPMVLMQDGDDPTRSDGEVLGESRWRHLRGRVRQGGQEDLHLLLHFRRQWQEGERHRKLRQEVQWGSQEHVTEQRRLLVHLWIQCQEGQGQDGQGYRCWRLYWRYWRRLRLWNV